MKNNYWSVFTIVNYVIFEVLFILNGFMVTFSIVGNIDAYVALTILCCLSMFT